MKRTDVLRELKRFLFAGLAYVRAVELQDASPSDKHLAAELRALGKFQLRFAIFKSVRFWFRACNFPVSRFFWEKRSCLKNAPP